MSRGFFVVNFSGRVVNIELSRQVLLKKLDTTWV